MDKGPDIFELGLKYNTIKVRRHLIGTQFIFRIVFMDKRLPMVITRASNSIADNFWTSVPEGRQKEAEEIGILISEYFKTI